jgi:hypothetical protein
MYSGVIVTENMRSQRAKFLTNEDVLKELKRIAKVTNKETVTVEDVRKYSSIMSVGVVARRFGSWAAAIEKAGLKMSEMYHREYSDEEYFENLLNVWTQHGRQPLHREMNVQPSQISAAAYEGHFGNWRKALEAFVVRMNQDERKIEKIFKEEKPTIIQPDIKGRSETIKLKERNLVEIKRDISLGLRYKVFSRDKFKCGKCGTSPATDHSCRLHVDHITPFSKGGKTILENLQTLCEKCNLGKGNRHSE